MKLKQMLVSSHNVAAKSGTDVCEVTSKVENVIHQTSYLIPLYSQFLSSSSSRSCLNQSDEREAAETAAVWQRSGS